MVCAGTLNPTKLCFVVRCAGLRLEILILILWRHETRNSCVKISLPCEASDGFKCDRFKVTGAVITWDGWGQIYSSDMCSQCCLRLCVVGEVSKRTPADQYRSGDLKFASSVYSCHCSLPWRWRQKVPPTHHYIPTYEDCAKSVRPFWIYREPVAWPWCNLAASQRRPYCASVNSYSPVGLVSRQWDAVDWACVLCNRRIHKYPRFQRRF